MWWPAGGWWLVEDCWKVVSGVRGGIRVVKFCVFMYGLVSSRVLVRQVPQKATQLALVHRPRRRDPSHQIVAVADARVRARGLQQRVDQPRSDLLGFVKHLEIARDVAQVLGPELRPE